MKPLMALLLTVAASAACAASAIDGFDFEDGDAATRYQRLLLEFRCPKCLNESLASSAAPIAQDLRRAVRRLLEEGKSDAAIRIYLQERYGDFVLYDPPLGPRTLVLWLSPLLLAAVVVFVLLRLARRWPATTPDERDRARALLRSRG